MTGELSRESLQARAMFEVDACEAHIDCAPCPSGMCQEEQGEMPNRALCFAHQCHSCASLLFDAGAHSAAEASAKLEAIAGIVKSDTGSPWQLLDDVCKVLEDEQQKGLT